jgi:uncharacterized protein (TIGR03435 family)
MAALTGTALWAFAQVQSGMPRPTFEVASVKAHPDTADHNRSLNNPAGGQLSCSNVTLRDLISYAFEVRDYQIVNAPAWAETEHYDVVAKPSAEDAAHEPPRYSDAANELGRRRTQALLAERFGLKVHEEQREMNVYSLVVAKGGAKLQPTQDTGPFPQMSWNRTRVTCKQVAMARFAKVLLADQMNRYVIDNTGLTGKYDIKMEFQPDEPARRDGASEAPAPAGPTFLQALEEQLGLRLVAAKGPVPFLSIDHVEKPSAN